jgi:flagellin-like hook-associated protein FlgL
MLFNASIANIQKQKARLIEVQEEAASGKRVRRPSDDVADTLRILSSRGTLATLEQFNRNQTTLNTLLRSTDAALEDVSNLLVRAKELAIQAANDTLTPSDRVFIAKEIEQLFAQAIQTGNSDVGGRYIFAGNRTDQPPLTSLIATENTASGLTMSGTITAMNAGDLTINGTTIRVPLAADDTLSTSDRASSALALATAINDSTPTTGARAEASTTLSLTVTSFGDLAGMDLEINGVPVTGTITDAPSLVAAVNAATIPGVVAFSTDADKLSLKAADGRNIQLATTGMSAGGLAFAGFDPGGAVALDQTTTGTVQLFSDTPFTIGGTNPAVVGLTTGTVDTVVGMRFTGDSHAMNIEMSRGQTIAANTIGSRFLVADLLPNLDANTPLSSLRQGQGINLGSITITDRSGNTSPPIDLTGATTIGDVLAALNGAAGITNVTAMVNAAANGITIVDTNSPTGNLIIQEVGSGTTAADLGIAANRPGNIVGAPLRPQLTPSTPLALLHEGQGVNLGTIHIANDTTEVDVDLSSANTIGDVISLINSPGANVTASLTDINTSGTNATTSINITGMALSVRSNDPQTVAIVTDVNNGTTTTDLGIQGPTDVLKTLSLLHEALENNDQPAIDRLLQHIDLGHDRVVELRADAGTRLNRVELIEHNHAELEISVTTLMSEAEDADVFEVFSHLTNLSTALQAALAATAHTVQLSLLDFLR